MNIKSLLLGSVAAFVAVTGARAADAIVEVAPSPEPAEYVRICDTYGTGFFYIPGTETCLKVGGYVRMRIGARDNTVNDDIDLDNLNSPAGALGSLETLDGTFATGGNRNSVPGFFTRGNSGDDYDVGTQVRARIEFDAREETELGMLRAFTRLQASNTGDTDSGQGTTGNDVGIDQAYIQLGGLTMGKLDSLWAERDGLFTDADWSVGDLSTNRVSYTFAVAGFTAAISAEDDGSGDFVPDVVGQLAYEGGWGSAYVSGVYDEQSGIDSIQRFRTGAGTSVNVAFPTYASTFIVDGSNAAGFQPDFVSVYQGSLNDSDDGAFALKGGATLKDLFASGSQLKVEGHYAFDPTIYAGDTGGNYIVPGGSFRSQGIFTGNGAGALPTVVNLTTNQPYLLTSEWQIGAGYQQQIDKLFLAVSGVYGETFDLNSSVQSFSAAGVPNGIRTTNLGNAEYFGVAGNVGYNITSNFSVLGEVSYREVDLPSQISNDLDTTAGFVEFKRSF